MLKIPENPCYLKGYSREHSFAFLFLLYKNLFESYCVCVVNFGSGLSSLGVILYFYFFIGLQFRAGQLTMPCLHKALFAVGNLWTHHYKNNPFNIMTTTIFEREKFFNRLIWLFPIVYVFHITEESNGFAEWVTNTLGGQMTLKPFLINNSAFMIVNIVCCYLAMKVCKPWATFILFFWVSAQEFWNFVFHVYTEFQFNAYSPGYFTAIFLYFPIYIYLSYLCIRDNHLSWKLWLVAFLLSSSAMAFTIWAGLYHFRSIPWDKWIP